MSVSDDDTQSKEGLNVARRVPQLGLCVITREERSPLRTGAKLCERLSPACGDVKTVLPRDRGSFRSCVDGAAIPSLRWTTADLTNYYQSTRSQITTFLFCEDNDTICSKDPGKPDRSLVAQKNMPMLMPIQTGVALHGQNAFLIGETYKLVKELGSGSMGRVYEAIHVRLGKTVAVKVARRDVIEQTRVARRFRREIKTLAGINSEHVVNVFDCGELNDGTPYLVMERLWGEDLKTLLARTGRLTIRRALHVALDACHGLSAVHSAGLVHRDVKPANLFIARRDSGEDLCKLLDFGMAKLPTDSGATQDGTVIGTVRYMAPEQLTRSKSATAQADIYALGAVLYECVAGIPAHDGSTIEELMFSVLNREPRALRDLGLNVPTELDRILKRALARDPKQRFTSTEELARALTRFAPQAGKSRLSVDGTETASISEIARTPSKPTRLKNLLFTLCVGAGTGFVLGSSTRTSAGTERFTLTRTGATKDESVTALSQTTFNPAATSASGVSPPPVLSAKPSISAQIVVPVRRELSGLQSRETTPKKAVMPGNRPMPYGTEFDETNPYEEN